MAEQQRKPVEQKKRPRVSDDAERSGGKKSSSVLAVTCRTAASVVPVAPSPAATRMTKLASPSPFAKAKPAIMAVKSAASSPSTATAPALVAPRPVATRTTPVLTPAPCPKAVVEPEDGEALEKAGEEMLTEAAEEEAVGGLTAKKKRLHCAACPVALKPPISMCGGGHAVCGDCAGANMHCGQCGGAATYTHVPCMDDLIGALELPCPYNKFGCGTSIAYHAVGDHKARCTHAPCYCLDCTPPFEGSPASLVRHLTGESGRHRWPAAKKIEYGSRESFVIPASSEDHRRLLMVEEDGSVFLLAVGAGSGGAGVRPVTIVCVRGSTGAGARPAYMGMLTVNGPPDEEGDNDILELYAKMTSCAVPGEVDMEHGRLRGHVIPEMLHGHGESKEVHLDIYIERFPDKNSFCLP